MQWKKESELIAAILAGDVQLYHQLICPYERAVYIMSLCYMKSEKEAEGVAQETFVRAFRELAAFTGDSHFGAWLIGIARSEARSRLQYLAPPDEPQREELPAFPALMHDWQELPPSMGEREEVRKLLERAIELLPAHHRQVLLLRDIGELNESDTAQILDIHASQVRVTLHQARMALQRFLAPKLQAIGGAAKKMQFQ